MAGRAASLRCRSFGVKSNVPRMGPLSHLRMKTRNMSFATTASTATLKDESFFNFTRGRFVCNEKDELAERHVNFDMDELLAMTEKSTGSSRCQSIVKFADGLSNKAFRLTMDDGREFVAKIPSPNAGQANYTTASEVATMDFMRNHPDTPAPKVHAWCCDASKTPVRSEYIIMEMARGVQLDSLWATMDMAMRLEVVKNIWHYQKRWLSMPLYLLCLRQTKIRLILASRLDPRLEETGQAMEDIVLHSTGVHGVQWRSDYVQWASTKAYCIRNFDTLPASLATLFGPGTYQPSREKKLRATDSYLKILDHVLPTRDAITKSYLCHTDLHAENIFVDPKDPARITSIIDWQSTEIAPLFAFADQPPLLNYAGPTHEGLTRPKLAANTSEMCETQRKAAKKVYFDQSLEVVYRMMVNKQAPNLYKALQFRDSTSGALLHAADSLVVDGEAQYMGMIFELEKEWEYLLRVKGSNIKYPFRFSNNERREIQNDAKGALEGQAAMEAWYSSMGDLWPEKGFVRHDQYNEAMKALGQLKEQVIERYAKIDEEARLWRQYWLFESRNDNLND